MDRSYNVEKECWTNQQGYWWLMHLWVHPLRTLLFHSVSPTSYTVCWVLEQNGRRGKKGKNFSYMEFLLVLQANCQKGVNFSYHKLCVLSAGYQIQGLAHAKHALYHLALPQASITINLMDISRKIFDKTQVRLRKFHIMKTGRVTEGLVVLPRQRMRESQCCKAWKEKDIGHKPLRIQSLEL